ncbi:MAG TPA: hypothetical protein VNJ04_10370 [Gemmatimonadaceae bacterium]|nr:hypothetical protein [Gemmatimonadaceae bacterium]
MNESELRASVQGLDPSTPATPAQRAATAHVIDGMVAAIAEALTEHARVLDTVQKRLGRVASSDHRKILRLELDRLDAITSTLAQLRPRLLGALQK